MEFHSKCNIIRKGSKVLHQYIQFTDQKNTGFLNIFTVCPTFEACTTAVTTWKKTNLLIIWHIEILFQKEQNILLYDQININLISGCSGTIFRMQIRGGIVLSAMYIQRIFLSNKFPQGILNMI